MSFPDAERLGDGQNSRIVMLARCVTRNEEAIETQRPFQLIARFSGRDEPSCEIFNTGSHRRKQSIGKTDPICWACLACLAWPGMDDGGA